jgi:tRNA pseudouridine38-40 synthase
VHATGQVASVDMPRSWTAAALRRSLNAILPRDVWVESVQEVPADFHPRYDALARTYTYRIGTVPEAASPFHAPWCWPLLQPLDRDLLERGAAPLPGEHSFRAFAKSGQPERGDRCSVTAATWSEWPLGLRFEITANRYLHHMVRYLVGTLVDVARGRRPLADVSGLLDPETRLECSPPAPPQGLFLTHVEYPHHTAQTHDDSQVTERRRTAPT